MKSTSPNTADTHNAFRINGLYALQFIALYCCCYQLHGVNTLSYRATVAPRALHEQHVHFDLRSSRQPSVLP